MEFLGECERHRLEFGERRGEYRLVFSTYPGGLAASASAGSLRRCLERLVCVSRVGQDRSIEFPSGLE